MPKAQWDIICTENVHDVIHDYVSFGVVVYQFHLYH